MTSLIYIFPSSLDPVRKPGPATMEHVLLALHETEVEREARIRGMFGFFDALGRGHLDHAQIESGLAALRVPDGGDGGSNEDYMRELLRACDRDGRVGYDDFRRYMDDKELELYCIFQAIDVEHNGCILPEELWHALIKVHPNSNALVVSTEVITPNFYRGSQRDMLLPKELMAIAGHALKSNNTTIGPLVLPMPEQLLFFFQLVGRKLINKKWRPYIPEFKLAFEHFCIHAGGRAMIDELQKNLDLSA